MNHWPNIRFQSYPPVYCKWPLEVLWWLSCPHGAWHMTRGRCVSCLKTDGTTKRTSLRFWLNRSSSAVFFSVWRLIATVQSRTNEEALNSCFWETVCVTWYEFMFYRNYIVGTEDKNWINNMMWALVSCGQLRPLAADCAPRSLLGPLLPAQHAGCTPPKPLVQLCFQWFKFCSPTKDSRVKQVFSKSSHSNPTPLMTSASSSSSTMKVS